MDEMKYRPTKDFLERTEELFNRASRGPFFMQNSAGIGMTHVLQYLFMIMRANILSFFAEFFQRSYRSTEDFMKRTGAPFNHHREISDNKILFFT